MASNIVKCQRYLKDLDFREARAVFLARYRMLPVKKNFPNRWNGTECNVCGFEDTDSHTFSCPGYVDINTMCISIDVFWDTEYLHNMDLLSEAASILVKMIERMEMIQKL